MDVTIAYIGGGSLNWAQGLMADLAHDTQLRAQVRLFDLNRAAAEENAALGARFAAVSKGTPAQYTVCDTMEAALNGADIVVISILPGRFEDMAKDIEIPARYGVPQSVGDSVGPGGFVRALRAIPMFAEIGRAIQAHAPKAYVCNLTNPMSALTGTLYKVFPQMRAWGECHEVTKLRKQVAWIGNRATPEAGWTHRDVEVNVLGINHFTFVDRISLGGQDMMPAYRAFAQEFAQGGWVEEEPAPDNEWARYFEDRSRVKFDLTARFGIAAAAGDRHLAEFLPVSNYLSTPEKWDFGLTPVEFRIRDNAERRAQRADRLSGKLPVEAKRSDEALVEQIIGLMGGDVHVSNVNMPNQGQISNLPQGAIVESNAMFSGQGVTPMMAGQLPAPLAAMMTDHATRQTALVGAVLDGRHADLFDLFRTDPQLAALDVDTTRAMFAEMTRATAQYLPDALLREVA